MQVALCCKERFQNLKAFSLAGTFQFLAQPLQHCFKYRFRPPPFENAFGSSRISGFNLISVLFKTGFNGKMSSVPTSLLRPGAFVFVDKKTADCGQQEGTELSF